jgi:hypothetical protein
MFEWLCQVKVWECTDIDDNETLNLYTPQLS